LGIIWENRNKSRFWTECDIISCMYLYNVKSCVHASIDATAMYKCTDFYEHKYARKARTQLILNHLTI